MWKRKSIFLSYRRDDNPGYVRRLQDDLQLHFGKESVFLDIENIASGQQWKEVLLDNLTNSAALVVVIGPRWEQIWEERTDKQSDYIVYELNKALELGVPVFPVTINGAELSKHIDLGPISWLKDKQHHDISDRQGRWPTDVLGLASILKHEKGLVIKKQKSGSKKRLLLIPAALAILTVIGILTDTSKEPDIPIVQSSSPISDNQPTKSVISALPLQPALPAPEIAADYPDISGIWQSNEGYYYEVGEVTDGEFLFGNEDIVGVGQFIPNMPNKISVQIAGLGHGEYAISANGKQMIGWFYYSETYVTLNYTLMRMDGGV